MGKKVAPLTIMEIRAAPIGKRLFDGDGLVVEIRQNGLGKYPYALMRYSAPNGRRREYGLGVVDVGTPASRGGVTLSQVRDQAVNLKRTVRKGVDLVEQRKQDKQALLAAMLATQDVPTLGQALYAFVQKESPAWSSTRYA